ncbi:MAG TPA: nitrate reductase molybdenum cofactor assembly chaperone [Burkholderiales bacterium]|nr:nitrate reductase molybdenum cofactor assembly chaperone [Burkholderiales bacterium]
MKTFKALGVLLAYPTRALLDALPDLYAVIVDEALVSRAQRDQLKQAMHWMTTQDLLDLEEQYVDWFDRGRATSLHLFEHVHGESRDRGQAMVDLKSMYEAAGLRLNGNELPDYLPAMLEYLSMRPLAEANEMIADCAHIVRGIGAQLAKRNSPYAAVIAAVLTAAGEDGFESEAPVLASASEKSMDEEWAEEPVVFGPAAAPKCGSSRPSIGAPR